VAIDCSDDASPAIGARISSIHGQGPPPWEMK
jgi:hypothetical protein